MASFRELVHEIHRRSLWQVLGIYAVASWVIWQVVVSLYEGVGLPDWVPATALVLLLVGLPIVLATAFVQEGAPGLGRDDGGDRTEGPQAAAPQADTAAARDPHRPLADAPPRDRAPDAASTLHSASTADPAPTPDSASTTSPAPHDDPGPHREPSKSTSKSNSNSNSIFTWPRAITAMVLAFAVLGIASAGFMGMRALGIGPAATLISGGALDEEDPIVLAEFAAPTGDSALAMVATRALRVDIGQSPSIRLVEPDRVDDILERMRRPENTRLTEDVAREVAIRGGWKAVISGDVATAAGAVVVSARVVTAESGEVLAAHRETARDSTAVIDAIDAVSNRLRSKIGESLASVRASPPLARITSSSLAAIRKFFEGWEEANSGNPERAIELLREAVALDTAFAFAYRKLASELNNGGRRAEAVEMIERALAHSDRLTEYEQLHVEGLKGNITGDDGLSIRSYERLLELPGRDPAAANNLALVYGRVGEFERAAEYMLMALHKPEGWQPGEQVFGPTFANAMRYAYNAGDPATADSVRELMDSVAPDHPGLQFILARDAAIQGTYGEARRHLEAIRELRRGSLSWQAGYHYYMASLAALEGRVGAADRALAEGQEIERQRGQPDGVLGDAAWRAQVAARVLGDTAKARELLAEARMETAGRIPHEDVPYGPLADAYAAAGQPDSVRAVLERFRTRAPEWFREGYDWLEDYIGAELALLEGRSADAIDGFHAAQESFFWLGFYVRRARAYERLDRPDSAMAQYETYLETPELSRATFIAEDPIYRAFVLERLADLHEQAGNRAEAVRYYRQFVDLWQNADPELQPRVDAARRALERLAAEG